MSRTLCILLASTLAMADMVMTIAHAQTLPDANPPVIEHDIIDTGEAGAKQIFSAQIVDDRELMDTTLYYRRTGQQAFTAVTLAPLGDSAFYSAAVKTDADDLRAIEYYLQARDAGGNRTIDGFAFEPHVRTMTEPRSASSSVLPEPAAAPTPAVSAAAPAAIGGEPIQVGGVRWWQVALGAVAVGTLVALASSSSSGGGGDDGTVPFSVNLTEPR